jgi:two-component system sensor histidine kinase UhpB
LAIREDVQRRIASDLHDSTCQHLVAVSLNITRMRRAIDASGRAAKLCDDIDASIDEAIREIRAFTYILYPPNLLADGLKITIEKFVEGFSLRSALKTDLDVSAEVDDLSIDAQRSILRVIQEALMNIFRHAKATRVSIGIEATGKHFELRISDNGRGMPASAAESSSKTAHPGVGIAAMGARLRELGSTLEIRSSSASTSPGTTLSARIPRIKPSIPAGRRAGLGGHKSCTPPC